MFRIRELEAATPHPRVVVDETRLGVSRAFLLGLFQRAH